MCRRYASSSGLDGRSSSIGLGKFQKVGAVLGMIPLYCFPIFCLLLTDGAVGVKSVSYFTESSHVTGS